MTASKYGDVTATVFDKHGIALDELPGVPYLCTWGINEATPAEMVLASRYDTRARRSLLRSGNIVEFNHANLGRWGGVITYSDGMDWTGSGEISVKMRSGYIQFNRRRTPLFNYVDNTLHLRGHMHKVIARLIDWANIPEDTRLRAYDLQRTSTDSIARLQDVKIIQTMTELLAKKRRKLYFWTEGGRDDNNNFVFNAFFRDVTKQSDSGYVLREGINIETPAGFFFRVIGEVINDIIVKNMGEEDGGLIRKQATDEESRVENGLFQDMYNVSTDSEELVEMIADDILDKQAWPSYQFMLTAVETPESPDTFMHLRVGKVVRVQLHSVGFYWGDRGVDVLVVIKSMEYSVMENKLVLTVETLEKI